MKPPTEIPVSGEVVATWRHRFAVASQKLGEGSGSESTWFWRLQRQLLHFLLRRYSAGDAERLLNTWPASAQSVKSEAQATSLDFKPSASFGTLPTISRPLRVGQRVRPILQDIVDSNHDRHEALERKRAKESAELQREADEYRAIYKDFLQRFKDYLYHSTIERSGSTFEHPAESTCFRYVAEEKHSHTSARVVGDRYL